MSDVAQVNVINTALAALGKEPVADLSDASLARSGAATKLLRSIDAARETVLVRHGWLCALQYATLPPARLANATNWRYPLAFQVPGASLRVWEVAGDILDGRELGHEPRWEFGTVEADAAATKIIRVRKGFEQICCDDGGCLNIAYVRLANWASLTPHVADAIGYDCARRQAYSITGDKTLAQALKADAENAVQMAISTDATQQGGQPSLAPSIPRAIRRFAGNADGTYGIFDRGYGYPG